MAQLESSYTEFDKRGASLVVITAQKIDGWFRGKDHVLKHSYPFPLLFDETRQVTHAYGVYQRAAIDGFNIAHPATFVVRPDGKIAWIGVSPTQIERPDIQEILKSL